jgi:hypothetical protein
VSSTDNLNRDAVFAVVEVLAEEALNGGSTAVLLEGEEEPHEAGCLSLSGVNSVEGKPCRACKAVYEPRYESARSDLCRLGVAKTKGKMRVVTMQSARVKRLLTRVNEAAYDRLSSFSWLVRGGVTVEQASRVFLDMRVNEGERIVSGDYVSSTDNLNRDAVFAVVEVLAEALPPDLGEVLLGSFRRTMVKEKEGEWEVLHGSMMGNLLSFVVLCLLNRVCYERARDKTAGFRLPGRGHREALINGDDCAFAGSEQMYQAWLATTDEVGFVINREKTMREHSVLELNSQPFLLDERGCVAVRKICFGFLCPALRSVNQSPWKSAFDAVKQMPFRCAVPFLTNRLVRGVLVTPPSAGEVPKRYWTLLKKRWWFRRMVLGEVVLDHSVSREKKVDYVLGPPLLESVEEDFRKELKEREKEMVKSQVSEWRGLPPSLLWVNGRMKSVRTPPSVVSRIRPSPANKRIRLRRGLSCNSLLWHRGLLEEVKESTPWVLDTEPGKSAVPCWRVERHEWGPKRRRLWGDSPDGVRCHFAPGSNDPFWARRMDLLRSTPCRLSDNRYEADDESDWYESDEEEV